MELKGTKTEQNLLLAFAGESQARGKYTYFADIAKDEGCMQIAEIFRKTASDEAAHAKMWLRILGGLGDTSQNLKEAAAGERYEHSEMYPEFAKTAREEGFTDIANLFEKVAQIESEHEKRFNTLIKNVDDHTVFSKDNEVMWVCRVCGYVHSGKDAPDICPVCGHPRGYFEVKSENY